MDKSKELGQVFTPDYVVDLILDDIGYTTNNIINKKIMEPSFGNGIFLTHIIKRLFTECEMLGYTKEQIIEQIENNVYGIEIDEECYNNTIDKLNCFADILGLKNINWNLHLMDALQWTQNGIFDYVVGNPPYIRIHNLSDENRKAIKDFTFSQGMADMYVIFFELGLNMLNENGKLGYITPNSYFVNTSQGSFRKYLLKKNLIDKIENYGSYKVFDNFDTYTCITILNKNRNTTNFTFSLLEGNNRKYVTNYDLDRFRDSAGNFSKDVWVLTNQKNLDILDMVKSRRKKISDYGTVQYGFATNKDDVYICKNIEPIKKQRSLVLFNGEPVESKLIKKIVKASKYHGNGNYYILFPYTYDKKKKTVEVIPEETMSSKYPKAYAYFVKHKVELESRDMDNNYVAWYQFARSQGLNNSFKEKLVLNHIVSGLQEKVEVYKIPEDMMVYSGIYITAPDVNNLDFIKQQLETKDFAVYAKLFGKDMSGGFKAFNTNVIKDYGVNSMLDNDVALKDELLERLTISYKESLKSKSSSEKVIPIHELLAEALQKELGEDYTVIADSYREQKEQVVRGKYYPKKVDVNISKDGNSLASIGVKFVCGNYSQNSNNYFENMLGETANLKRNDEYYGQFIVLPLYVPYFNDNGKLSKLDYITDENLLKYALLDEDSKNYPHNPNIISFILIDFLNQEYLLENKGKGKTELEIENHFTINYADLDNSNLKNEKVINFIKKHNDVEKFVKAVADYARAKSYGM